MHKSRFEHQFADLDKLNNNVNPGLMQQDNLTS